MFTFDNALLQVITFPYLIKGVHMNRLDVFFNGFIKAFNATLYRFMYFIMFRKKADCKHFCITCEFFDTCMQDVKSQYASERIEDDSKNSGQ